MPKKKRTKKLLIADVRESLKRAEELAKDASERLKHGDHEEAGRLIRRSIMNIWSARDTVEPYLAGPTLFGIPVLSCAVKSNQGQRCPELPTRVVTIDGGEEILLCSRCYDNACAGAYGDVSVVQVREID